MEESSRDNTAALGTGSWFPLKGYTGDFWAVWQLKWEKLTVCCPQTGRQTPDWLESESWWGWLPTVSLPTSEEYSWADDTLFDASIVNSSLPAPGWDTHSWGLSALWVPLCLAKQSSCPFQSHPKQIQFGTGQSLDFGRQSRQADPSGLLSLRRRQCWAGPQGAAQDV